MFTNVHEIVHDSFFCFLNRSNPVITSVNGVVEFYVSGIFMNNWAILIFSISFQSATGVVFDWLGGT